MRFIKTVMIALLPLFFCYSTFAQDFRKNPGYRFSKEDISDYWLYQGKKEKTKGLVCLIAGSLLTGVGFYIANNSPTVVSSGGRDVFPTSIGRAIGATGLVTTFVSLPFFMSASKFKREAQLIVARQSTGLLNSDASMTRIGLRFTLR